MCPVLSPSRKQKVSYSLFHRTHPDLLSDKSVYSPFNHYRQPTLNRLYQPNPEESKRVYPKNPKDCRTNESKFSFLRTLCRVSWTIREFRTGFFDGVVVKVTQGNEVCQWSGRKSSVPCPISEMENYSIHSVFRHKEKLGSV